MSLRKSFQTLEVEAQKPDRSFFLKNFENEVQIVFNEISRTKNALQVSFNVLKGSIYLKADYFIPMKNSDIFQLNCKELLEKLKTISSVLSVEVDLNYNLIFCLKRDIVYKSALGEVLALSDDYGMTVNDLSVLVLIDMQESKTFDNLRNVLLAEHIISILSANKVKVYHTEASIASKIKNCNVTLLQCSSKGSLNEVYKELHTKARSSEWIKDFDDDENLCLDAKKYIESNALVEKYGKSIHGIILQKEDGGSELYRTCILKHSINQMPRLPDYIIHIASQGQNRNIYKSGILLGMLEKLKSIQVYIFNQSVQYKNAIGKTSNDFIGSYKLEIERATSHKYDSYDSEDSTWSNRIESLVDTAVKFDFLRMNHSNVLNLRPPAERDGEKNYGIFVQYNFARLSNLFQSFQSKVTDEFYHPLSSLEESDFSLLKLEEEWNLFHYVLSFPKIVQNIISSLLPNDKEKNQHKLNKVCLMLQELCQHLSLYYSKVRILCGPQLHLQKTMNARLWLLKGIYQILKNSFILLNVHGLELM